MTEPELCELKSVSKEDVTEIGLEITNSFRNMDIGKQTVFSASSCHSDKKHMTTAISSDKAVARSSTTTSTSDSELGVFLSELCEEHQSELNLFCCSEQKLICSQCSIEGSCQGHTVTLLSNRVSAVRNQLVDVCENMQLQALRFERFINQALVAKEKALQVEASGARERVLAQVKVVREALEEEEQRLLEEVQREEERVEQCLLTQRAHWSQALEALSHTRSSLVHTLTHTHDTQLATASLEIAERIEKAEGLGEPCDTEQLNLDPGCSESKLMKGLWASAILLGPIAYSSVMKFDERTVSPLLSLSEDLCTLTKLPKKSRSSPQYDPARFDCWPNALGSISLASGTHSWVIDVGQCEAFKVGVCYTSMERKGSGNEARLGYNSQSWVLSHYDGDFSFCHAGRNVQMQVVRKPRSVGLLLDWPSQTLLFYDPSANAVLHTVRHSFTAPLVLACAVADRSVTILNSCTVCS